MAQSLKAKRSIVQSIVRTVDGWKSVGSAEVGYLDKWQRAELGFAIVSGSAEHAGEVADSVERFVWSQPDIEVTSMNRSWMESV
jgi:uncharacterized protein YlxP (DUF503 family)